MPVPYSPPNVGAYTRTPSHQPLVFSRRGTDHLSSDDLLMPKLSWPACRCEWWWRLVSPSTGGDWWATCHDESCARYSRLQVQCGIRVSPLLPPRAPFTYSGSVLLGRQLRALCLETELEKRQKKSGVSISLSVPLGKGDRVRAGYIYSIGRLVSSVFIVCICTYGWWYCFGREYLFDFDSDRVGW